jgi:hypothetical protein
MICGVFKHLGAAVKRHQTPSLATISFRLKKRKGKRWSVAKQKEASMRIHDRSIHAVVGERDAGITRRGQLVCPVCPFRPVTRTRPELPPVEEESG